ncbi:MAG: hypothetical protein IJ391_06120 [Clostridia bacterium]|nr:hypothetical protein [Clostridia bacterium]
MKNKLKVPVLDRRSFYILKNGTFLIITMLAVTMLLYNSITSNTAETTRVFLAVRLARIMIEHTLVTLNIVIGGALLCDIIVKSEKY